MKIQIMKHIEPTKDIPYHRIEVRLEQEYEDEKMKYENNVNSIVEIHSEQAKELIQDELYTLATKKAMIIAEREFKKTGYINEKLTSVEFSLIPEKFSKFDLVIPEKLYKTIGKEMIYKPVVMALDQYGNVLGQANCEITEGVNNVNLRITYEDEVKIHDIPVEITEVPKTDLEIMRETIDALVLKMTMEG